MLADLVSVDGTEAKQDFAEKLGQWLDVADAIAVSAALHARPAPAVDSAAGPAGERAVAVSAIDAECTRVRTVLAAAIAKGCAARAGEARLALSAPTAATESALAYAPFYRFYLGQQREMDTLIGPLRSQVRAALTGASPTLKQLAALDGVLGETLSARERRLLATVPLLFEKRFAQLFEAHRQTLRDTRHSDDADLWMAPGGWLARFRDDLQNVLLAELALRLQPVVGLIEAFSNEVINE